MGIPLGLGLYKYGIKRYCLLLTMLLPLVLWKAPHFMVKNEQMDVNYAVKGTPE